MALKVGDYLVLHATVRAVHAEWAELDITAAGTEPVAPIRVPLGFLVQREETVNPEHLKAVTRLENLLGADMKALASTINSLSTGKAKRIPNHDRA